VTADTNHFLDLLERRILLLDSLAAALTAARADVVAFDLDGLESRIADQEHLCADIRSLDASIDRVQNQCATQLGAAGQSAPATSPNDTIRMHNTLSRLREAQISVKHLNDAHQHLLRRSRRTVLALLNSYRTFALTYSDPASAQTAIGERV
jgi:hypothetical protein